MIKQRPGSSVWNRIRLRIIRLLQLAAPHHERRIRIVVAWPDGSEPGPHPLQIFRKGALLKKGAVHGGVYEFTGYQERDYEFSARYWVDNLGSGSPVFQKRVSQTNAVHLAPGKDEVEARLVLGEPKR